MLVDDLVEHELRSNGGEGHQHHGCVASTSVESGECYNVGAASDADTNDDHSVHVVCAIRVPSDTEVNNASEYCYYQSIVRGLKSSVDLPYGGAVRRSVS